MAEGLSVERQGQSLVATVDSNESNLFSPSMIAELGDQLEAGGRDPGMSFFRLRARGPAFCLGREAPAGPPRAEAIRKLASSIVRVNELLQTIPLVTIVEVQGDAAGFGAGLVGNADIAVAVEGSRFSFPEILDGFAPSVVMSWLPQVVPKKRAFEMVSTGEWVGASQALDDGLVTEVVSGDDLEIRVDERIASLTKLSGEALRDVKGFLASTRSMSTAEAAETAVDTLVVGVLRATEFAEKG